MDPEIYRAWEERMAVARKACLACEQSEYLATAEDLSECQPGVYFHGGEFCKRPMCPAAWGDKRGGVRCILKQGHGGLHEAADGSQALPMWQAGSGPMPQVKK
jgi:hypothetical protein